MFRRLRHGRRIKPELFAFDLLELDGEDLRPMPIEARQRNLAQLVRNVAAGLHLSEHLHGDGTEIFEQACKLGCEGIVSKRVGSRYVSGRTDKLDQGQEPGGACGQARGRGRPEPMTQATDQLIEAFPKVWCPNCGAEQPVEIAIMKADEHNAHDGADILCGVCRFVVATLHADAPSHPVTGP